MARPSALLGKALEVAARVRAPKEPPAPLGGPLGEAGATLERAPCPLCGAARGRVVVEGEDDWLEGQLSEGTQDAQPRYGVLRCEVCTARYTSPRYRPEARRLAFPDAYPYYLRAQAARRGEGLDPGARRAAKAAFLGRADRLSRLRPRPGRLLDLGAGDGFFLEVMRERGWEVVGADLSEVVTWHAREVLGLPDVRVLDAEADPLPEGPFDAVTLWGVLQLAYRPLRLLEKVRGVLAPGGLVGVGVSNARGLGARVFGARWRGLGLPRHLVHFTPETLERLVRFAGLTQVELSFETPRWIVSGSVENVLPRALPTTKLVKLAGYGMGALAGRTRLGDTMELYAELRTR